jgi:TonB-dependent starch-binding outer membrane protein SusC
MRRLPFTERLVQTVLFWLLLKTGKKNTPTKVSFDSSYGIQETSRKLPVLNATEYAVLLNESYAASGQTPPFSNISNLGTGTNWQNELFETAPIITNNINVSGGSEKVVYSISASNLSQDGIIGLKKSGFDRSTAKMNFGADMAPWVKFSSSLIFRILKDRHLTISDWLRYCSTH